ncbi:MAG: endopeptidase La [Candidatus Tectomicrobia bacterium]|nr:endopeptidase La [Candidatus Tectomicrobia bacterium]
MDYTSSQAVYPVLPLKHAVLFPDILMPVAVGRPQSVAAVEAAQASENQKLIVAAQRDPDKPVSGLDDLYPVATVAIVTRVLQRQDNVLQVFLQGQERVSLSPAPTGDAYLQVNATPLPKLESTSEESIALFRNIRELVAKAVQQLGGVPEEMAPLLMHAEKPATLAYLVATMLNLELEEAINLLKAESLLDLLRQVHQRLAQEVHILELRQKIAGDAKSELDKTQREYVLRQQLKQIQKELGEDAEQDEVELLRQQLQETELPDEIRVELERELDRLQRLNPAAPDYQVLRSYLEFALELPWSDKTTDQLDLAHAQDILNEDHFGLDDVKDRIIEHLAVMALKPDATSPILCLVGPPGVGKTSLGQSVARALGRRFERFSLGGVHDEAELRGHRRTYVGALPGRILQAVRRAGVSNPVLMLDEVDKLGRDFRGDPASALLEILDPAQNHTFRDHYLDLPFDLSHTLFLCTANTLETIPGPLLDRMEILNLPGYSEEEKLKIAQQYLMPRRIEQTGLTSEQLPLAEATLRRMISHYTREAGVRQLERTIGRIAQKIARKVAVKEALPSQLEPEDLEDLLGPEMYLVESVRKHPPAGVVAGLAVTPTGGDVLYVEAQLLPGGKGLTLTGQLGDVMRESAEIARNLLWAEASRFGIKVQRFDKNGLHIHVPAGATPKDGPSAGIAMATALTSLLTNKPVRDDTAMTGEITLSGLVLPVGGVKEKVLAARRAGLTRVILPKANAKDLRKLPAEVSEEMEFVFVERFNEVIDDAIPQLELTFYSEIAV